ncbi:pilus assembly protein TadG-related protein [Croceicoccus pelagius]|uniref:Putative Flp pilus-assembly TadG-like N-terminal domain-containing protein n=1 Tax=Croceicoccus pelagius TaxID=1703341 RepID=A0A916YIR3_9SPHN|nr:pilus assembly protein TadG-related protein [Croceicoccus pelagius]GGD46564.1 hypothetical protein GCM10010989_21000 [Croceicoccus pelagius]
MILRRSAKSACRFFKRFRRETSANALILTAFGMPMVIGGGGFAIDFAQYYLWKRELQYAADQAAMAAAWELAENPNSTEWAARGLTEFNANEAVTADFNGAPTIVKSHYAGVLNNAVTVNASATKRLPFTSYFTKNDTTVSVMSQAAFTGGATVSNCLISLEEGDSDAIRLNGDALFTAGCGIMAMSNSKRLCVTSFNEAGECVTKDDGTSGWEGRDAIVVNGQPTIDAGSITSAGTIDDQLNYMTDDIILENVPQDQLVDPFKDVVAPVDLVSNEGSYTCKATGKGKNSGETVELGIARPGIYDRGLTVACDTTFQAGIYVINGGTLKINGDHRVIGNDIMFVLTGGAQLALGGTAQTNLDNTVDVAVDGTEINLQGITYDTLMTYPGMTDEWAKAMMGMLIFEDPDSEGANPSGEGNGHLFAGTSNTWISGSVYLPKSSITMAGTAQVANMCLMIVANKVTLTGTTDMTEFCPEGESHETSVIYGTVKLIA